MRKRIGALSLAAVLLLAMICPALAAGTTFVVKGPDQAPRKGETFTVVVELENNPGFNAIGFTLTYDKDKMTCTEAGTGEEVSGMLSATNPSAPEGAIVVGASVDAMKANGPIGVFSFIANSDLTGMEFGLKVDTFCDAEGNNLPYEVEINGAKQDAPFVAPEQNPPEETAPEIEGQPVQGGDTQPTTTPVKEASFTDTKGHWAESYISRAAELGMFKGYPDGSFGPNVDVTRAQYVTVLYRMAGSPSVTAEAPFTDIVGQSEEFRSAIAWGYENGYLNGRSETVFDPGGSVTRQEAMKILCGYAGGGLGMEAMLVIPVYDEGFNDSGELASWGKEPMYWGVYHKIISGTSETTLSPNGTATRGQLAKILTVFFDQQTN